MRFGSWIHAGLCVAGTAVAGLLTAAHYLGRDLPCGAVSAGCQTVARDSWAIIFGQPSALYGFLLYVVLGLLTFGLGNPRVRQVAFALSSLGLLASIAFTVRALGVIQASCVWCLASAVIMACLFLLHYKWPKKESQGWRPALAPGLAALVLGSGGGYGVFQYTYNEAKFGIPYLSVEVNSATQEEWVPKDAHVLGDPNAPVTLIEFADFRCKSCREFSVNAKALVAGIPRLRLVYRHLPLTMIPGHEKSDRIAALSEIAAEKGKFWDFMTANDQVEDGTDLESYRLALEDFEVDFEAALQRVSDGEDAAVAKVKRDMDFAKRLGLNQTPTLVLLVPGQRPRVLSVRGLREAFEDPDVVSILAPSGG